jgi:predicted enzyme related to lactoylglutathione lyase
MPDLELKLGWVIVYVERPAEASAFYTETFGTPLELAMPL